MLLSQPGPSVRSCCKVPPAESAPERNPDRSSPLDSFRELHLDRAFVTRIKPQADSAVHTTPEREIPPYAANVRFHLSPALRRRRASTGSRHRNSSSRRFRDSALQSPSTADLLPQPTREIPCWLFQETQ